MLLRVKLTDGGGKLGAGLQDPHAGDLERKIIFVPCLNEVIERRVVEILPPDGIVDRPSLEIFGVLIVTSDIGPGCREVGADHAAGQCQGRKRGKDDAALPGHQGVNV